MASYSPLPITAFATSSDDLATLLLSLPPLPAPLTFSDEPTFLRRRSNTTLAMLMRSDDEDVLRCRYPSKLCRHARVRKASGALHRYCAYHRDKANANQKRWVDRQRETMGSPTASSVSSPLSMEARAAQTKYRWILASSTPRSTGSTGSTGSLPATSGENETSKKAKTESSARGAAILDDDDWDALLTLLRPLQASNVAPSRCDPRRRANSSPMPPTFMA